MLRRRITLPGTAFAAAALVFCACSKEGGAYSATRSIRVAAAGVSVLRLDAGSGYLRVVGHRGAGDIIINGVAAADSRALLDKVQLASRRSGDTLVVTTFIPAYPPGTPARRGSVLDLMIQLPANVALDVTDSSGDAFFRDVGPLRVVHGDGRLEADTVLGAVDITDGNGEMLVDYVAGNVHIIDGGGSIHLFRIQGSVDIPKAGDGEIKAFDVSGDVRIGSKSSGQVLVNGVGGNLLAAAHGDGSIEYRNVKGRVGLPVR